MPSWCRQGTFTYYYYYYYYCSVIIIIIIIIIGIKSKRKWVSNIHSMHSALETGHFKDLSDYLFYVLSIY
jgi:hypothetical protein